jgi:histidine ammonia-lyase
MTRTRIVLDGGALTRAEVVAVAEGPVVVELGVEARVRIIAAAELIARVAGAGQPVYGVTTGFGSLESVRIPDHQLSELQVNIVRSHAVGVGDPLPVGIVRGMLILLAASLSRGHSGVRVELVESLVALLNAGITPVVPSRGSVGASGDLAPLAHLALVLIGEGAALLPDGELVDGTRALSQAGVAPIALGPKEGLALLNGTHLMASIGAQAVTEAGRLYAAAQVAAAMIRACTTCAGDHSSRRLRRACSSSWTARRCARAMSIASGCRTRTRCAAFRRYSGPSARRWITWSAPSSRSSAR